MIKKINKYMDDLKSPYWEPIGYFIFLLFVFSSIITILTASPELASKLGNIGSFLGGGIAVLAFILAVREYLKFTRHKGLDELINLQAAVLSDFEIYAGHHKMKAYRYAELTLQRERLPSQESVDEMRLFFKEFSFKVKSSLMKIKLGSPHLSKQLDEIENEFNDAMIEWHHLLLFLDDYNTKYRMNKTSNIEQYHSIYFSKIVKSLTDESKRQSEFSIAKDKLDKVLLKIKELN